MSRDAKPELVAPDPQLDARVASGLDQVEAFLESSLGADVPLVSDAALHLLAAGGKRFRPMLVLLSSHLGDPADPRLIAGAAAIELTHLASLYHDDVIDEADSRRGAPSVNARWGNTVAVLTGDYLFARSSEISAELGTDVSKLLAATIAQVCQGQILEAQVTGRVDVAEAEYLEVIRRKTAALIATSCRLGGMLAGVDPPGVERLTRFGRALGMAFQLSDDIMDITEDEAALGKEPGVDLKEGVYTLPVIHALKGDDGRLRALLAEGPPSGERLRAALDLVRTDGALDRAREAVSAEVGQAVDEAEGLEAGPAREALTHLARFLAERCGARE
ncbi:MAG TPA: polyprenyl synthetase family protein [Actinomycetota bacterium]